MLMQLDKDLGGRPKTEIDKDVFEGLCEIQCTKNEMCSVFKCDEKTLTRWCKDTYGMGFSDVYKKESETGKTSLRRMQWNLAKSGNATMQLWLGKQYLDQRDKQEVENTNIDLTDTMTAEQRQARLAELLNKKDS